MKVGYFGSGHLGFHCLEQVFYKDSPVFIFTDRKSDKIINFAKNNDIPFFVGNPRNEDAEKFIKTLKAEVLFSINYLFVLDHHVLNTAPEYSINIHGSLLPKYRGRSPHIWAIINGEPEAGVTAHFIDSECDAGGIILQEKIPIEDFYTGQDLLDIYFGIYPQMITKIQSLITSKQLVVQNQDSSKATYFSKRNPDDGAISWDWQKERIYNWVRALSDPYPGAFTYYNGRKIILDNIKCSEQGFSDSMPNGLILSIRPFTVKTPNGAIEVIKFRENYSFDINHNNRFGNKA